MNILQISRIIAKTGVGNHIKELSEELVMQGHDVWVISSTNDMKIEGTVTYKKVNLTTKNIFKVFQNLKIINNVILDNEIEIVHCHHRMAAIYMSLYNKFWKIPYVYTLHLAPIPSDWIHRQLTKWGAQAIAISHEVGVFLHEKLRVPESDISYVLNGVDEKKLNVMSSEEKYELRKQIGIPDNKIVIALHSRIAEVKNHLGVVEAVSLIPKEERDRFVVVCSGEKAGSYFNSVIEKISKEKLEDNFIFLGWVNARTILGTADALLLPSFAEGFPLNCIEAMFMNVPIIRTKTGGYEDIRDYCIGMEDATPKTIRKYIELFINNEIETENMVANACMFAHKNCSVSVMTQNAVNVYQNVLDKQS